MRNIISGEIVIDRIIACEENDKKQIMSRFGLIKIDLSKTILFNNGLLGMVDKMSFCLANFPQNTYGNFKVLQSTEDDNLSFIILPLGSIEEASHYINEVDLLEAINQLHIEKENVSILLITSVHQKIDGEGNKFSQISVNMKAPLIIDTLNFTGVQHVFYNDIYKTQHIIT
jgi:flagellar assembly factor FliW